MKCKLSDWNKKVEKKPWMIRDEKGGQEGREETLNEKRREEETRR